MGFASVTLYIFTINAKRSGATPVASALRDLLMLVLSPEQNADDFPEDISSTAAYPG